MSIAYIAPIQVWISKLLALNWNMVIQAGMLIGGGMIAATIATTFVKKVVIRNASLHHQILVRYIVGYPTFIVFCLLALEALGFDKAAIFAGIFTVGLGLAAQSVITNLISGIILLADKTFIPGEEIVVDKIAGEVLSIDSLSIKMRTKENALVRLPNETVLKSSVCNISRFPIRRFDIHFHVSCQENITTIKDILLDIAHSDPSCLQSPPPEFFFIEFRPTTLHLQLSVWSKTESFLKFKSDIQIAINLAFQKQGIALPLPTHNQIT